MLFEVPIFLVPDNFPTPQLCEVSSGLIICGLLFCYSHAVFSDLYDTREFHVA